MFSPEDAPNKKEEDSQYYQKWKKMREHQTDEHK